MKGEHWNSCKCPVCGKVFWVGSIEDWVYKVNRRVICSWGCLRKAEKAGKRPKESTLTKPGYVPPEHWYRMRELRDKGMSHREIAKRFGIRETSVGSIISKLNQYEKLKGGGANAAD